MGGHFKMYTDHSSLKYMVNKLVLGARICHCLLLFQEFDFEFIDKPSLPNSRSDHLLRIESGEEPSNLDDSLHDAQLFAIIMFNDR